MNGLVPGGTAGHGPAGALARAVIARHSRSFALASRLLAAEVRADVQVLYAWCRRADDAVDGAPPAEQPERLRALRAELDGIYAGRPCADPLVAAFQRTVWVRAIPHVYPEALLSGMEMDACGVSYPDMDRLLCYCYRVAGTVGLMMCHVMGVRSPEAVVHAAHLGIAMQLTNIARDVLEDWRRGRLYLPGDLLANVGAGELRRSLGGAFPEPQRARVARANAALLAFADRYYASGDAGLGQLSLRCGLAVRTARLVYADIGRVLRARACDPLSGRATVSRGRKLWLLSRAVLRTLSSAPAALGRPPPGPPPPPADPRDLWVLSEVGG